MKLWIAAALLAFSQLALAQNPRVLLDTDRGPLLLELDAQRAPNTVANFLSYVDDGSFNATLLHRVVRNFVVQGGGFRDNAQTITKRPAINSERNNGLVNEPGTIAMALSGNPPNINSATSDFFINTGTNTALNEHFTVFGRVVFGLRNLESLNTTPVFAGSEQPIRPPLIRRAVRVAPDQFPILSQHTGAWYDPARSGRGIVLEVANAAGSAAGPLMVVSWYDFFEGEQAWFTGVAPFQWGAHQVTVPLQVSAGGQFGEDFDPSQVVSDPQWGTLTIRFTGCGNGVFSYQSAYGEGTMNLRHLTKPTDATCVGN